jgi:hypothetical protein
MARRRYRKGRIAKAAEAVWGRYARHCEMLINSNQGIMRVTHHYRDESYIRPGALRGVAASYNITVDELKAALAPTLLADKLDRAIGR